MSVLGIDLGGTKAAFAVFSRDGDILMKDIIMLGKKNGDEVGSMIGGKISGLIENPEIASDPIEAIGISVPGIYRTESGTVWAPNISGWDDYPLLKKVEEVAGKIPVAIDNDRACSITGEIWKGSAAGCRNAVFLAIGTGIGAGIVVNGEVLRGSHDIAGSAGWMALGRPFNEKYIRYGFFEYHASGDGMARETIDYISSHSDYDGFLRQKMRSGITSHDIFKAYESGDIAAAYVITQCIEIWGMALANIVSLFNPDKVIFGGGVFGPAIKFLPEIKEEAMKWGQPVSMKLAAIEPSSLGGDAPIYGAGYLALKNLRAKGTDV
jgi:glucokinase